MEYVFTRKFDDIISAAGWFCTFTNHACHDCPLKSDNDDGWNRCSRSYIAEHPEEVAEIIGLDIVDDAADVLDQTAGQDAEILRELQNIRIILQEKYYPCNGMKKILSKDENGRPMFKTAPDPDNTPANRLRELRKRYNIDP